MSVQNQIAETDLTVLPASNTLKILSVLIVFYPNIHVTSEKWDGGHTQTSFNGITGIHVLLEGKDIIVDINRTYLNNNPFTVNLVVLLRTLAYLFVFAGRRQSGNFQQAAF